MELEDLVPKYDVQWKYVESIDIDEFIAGKKKMNVGPIRSRLQ